MRFVGGWEDVWEAIRARIDRRRPIIAAIAYLSSAKNLRWKRGDVLIANFSMAAVKAGASNPHVALQLQKNGVEIRSANDLHAKVIANGNWLFVGSMNASKNAEGKLLEAMVAIDDRDEVSRGGRWLNDVKADSELLTDTALLDLAKFYKPPKGGGGEPGEKRKRRKTRLKTEEAPAAKTWLFYSTVGADDEAPAKVEDILAEGPEDERFVGFEKTWYHYGAEDKRKVRPGDFVIFFDEVDGVTDVWPAAEIWRIAPIDGELWLFVAYRSSDWQHTIPWREFKKFARSCGMSKLRSMKESYIKQEVAAAIRRDWPWQKPKSRRK